MRILEALSLNRYKSKLNGAYKRFLKDDDYKIVLRDIVGFSQLGLYNPEIDYTDAMLHELRGRQQMALHILRHLDVDAVQQIELQNDALMQATAITEDNPNG